MGSRRHSNSLLRYDSIKLGFEEEEKRTLLSTSGQVVLDMEMRVSASEKGSAAP